MKKNSFTVVLVIAIAQSVSCTTDSQTSELDVAGIDSVYASMSRAYTNFDLDLIDQVYRDNAYSIYAPDSAALAGGRERFIAGFKRTFDYHRERKNRLHLRFKNIKREGEGNFAYDIGYFTIDVEDSTGNIKKGTPGKFVTVLRRQGDLKWRFAVDIFGNALKRAFEDN